MPKKGAPPVIKCGRCIKVKSKCKCGRPKAINEKVLKLLHHAFSIGASDEEACMYAKISHQTLYTFQKENPEFLEYKRELKLKPTLQARHTIVKKLKKDAPFALKYMERKVSKEFSPKQQITHVMGGVERRDKGGLTEAEKAQIKDVADMFKKKDE